MVSLKKLLHDDALQKNESNDLLIQWQHQLLWYCHRSLVRDTLAPFLLILCIDYMIMMSRDLMKENGLTLKKK